MINIYDDYLDESTFKTLQDYVLRSKFKIQKAGEKEYCILPTPLEIIPLLEIKNHNIVLTFIRKAYEGFDNDLRIHADNIINGHKTIKASVLYLNKDNIEPNGTCFYKHHKYGEQLPKNVTNTEFDLLITKDSNDPTKWEKTDSIINKPNRFLVYDSNFFHSKYPKEIKQGERIVLVTFYSDLL